MSNIVIIQNARDLDEIYAEALDGTGHAVKIIGSDTEAMDYLVRHRKAPDVMILDMRWPGSTEMVVMGAACSLPHLAHTKVLIIKQDALNAPQTSPSWRADLVLSPPVSPGDIRRAIHILTTGLASEVPEETESPDSTRVWWEGTEAVFVRWTEQSLVLAWPDTADTAVKIPRSAVTRLLQKGVLQIEGDLPGWARLPRVEFPESVLVPSRSDGEAASAVSSTSHEPAATSGGLDRHAEMAASQASAEHQDKPASKLNIVARLIRRLTRDNAPQRPYEPSRATPGP